MADSRSLGIPTPIPLYVYITRSMQALYAVRGMWSNGSPQGALTGMLGEQVPFLSNDYRQAFYVTLEQMAALERDIGTVPAGAIGHHQRAQFLRRLREAARRGSLDLPAVQSCHRGEPAADPCAVPFQPLVRPTHGKAAALFEEHVMRTVRDFIDFTQSSDYLQGAGHA